jgi:hypothetical protein
MEIIKYMRHIMSFQNNIILLDKILINDYGE